MERDFLQLRKSIVDLLNRNGEFKFSKCSLNVQLYFLLKFHENVKNSKICELNFTDKLFLRNCQQKIRETAVLSTVKHVLEVFSPNSSEKYQILSIKFLGRQTHQPIYGALEFFSSFLSLGGFFICLYGHFRVLKKEKQLRQGRDTISSDFDLFTKNFFYQSLMNLNSTAISTIFHTNPHFFLFIFSDYLGVFAICWFSTFFNWWKLEVLLLKREILHKGPINIDLTENKRVSVKKEGLEFVNVAEKENSSDLSIFIKKTKESDLNRNQNVAEKEKQIIRYKSFLIPYAVLFCTQFFFFSKEVMKFLDLFLIIMLHYYEYTLPQILKQKKQKTIKQKLTEFVSKIEKSFSHTADEQNTINEETDDEIEEQKSLELFICAGGLKCTHKKKITDPCDKIAEYRSKVSKMEYFLACKLCTIGICIFVEFLDFPPILHLFDSHTVWHLVLLLQSWLHYQIEEIEMEIFHAL